MSAKKPDDECDDDFYDNCDDCYCGDYPEE